jgi:hypothetical protein
MINNAALRAVAAISEQLSGADMATEAFADATRVDLRVVMHA